MTTEHTYIRGGSFTMHVQEIGENRTLCTKLASKFPHTVWSEQRDQFTLCSGCKKELETRS